MPSRSNIKRRQVVKRKRPVSRDKKRRTGSDFTQSFPIPGINTSPDIEETDLASLIPNEDVIHEPMVPKNRHLIPHEEAIIQ